jgi:site-specific DNA-methyltransferase (adenine-specific)
MEYMKTVPDKYFELAIVDPPYGINADREHYEGHGWVLRKQKGWDKKPPEPEYFQELQRISVNQIIWGGNYFIENLKNSQCWVIWDKGQRSFSLADAELAWTSFDELAKIIKLQVPKNGKIHPTQKPVALYDWILKNYAKEGDLILDTHLGSGSSRIAAHRAGLSFVGCELDKDYFDAANKRFKDFTAQLTLF